MTDFGKFRVDDIDILSQVNNVSLSVDSKMTGLEFLIKEIRAIADDVFPKEDQGGGIKNIFIEYCSIAVMLSDSKMIGFAALDDNNDALFNTKVKKHAFNIIGAITGAPYGLSILVHPDFISRSAVHNSDVGSYHCSYLDSRITIEEIAHHLDITLDDLEKDIKEALKSSESDTHADKIDLYWAGTYNWTYDKLIKSIDAFRSKYQQLPPVEELFTLFKHYYDFSFAIPNEKSCYVGIPLLGAQAGDMPISGQGAAFIYFTYDNNAAEEKIREFISRLSPRIDYILKGYLFNLLAYSALTLKEQSRQEAIKAAKAAIMARNMSHNLGSHVMAYLKQHLSSVTNIIQDNVLADLNYRADISSEGGIALPFLVGVGHFISYLQERQDFIATIATDFIPSFATVNFKDAIYDNLGPDKRFQRHPKMKNFLPDNILLGNIARSEGLGREIRTTRKDKGRLADIVLKFRDFDGDPVVDNNGNVLKGRETASKSLEYMRSLDISLPGGVVGRQAIFSIVENIIRNAAKHGNWRDNGKLELTFDFINEKSIKYFAELKNRERVLEVV